MSDPKDRQTFLNLCEMAIDNMHELEAIGILLEQKGLLTKQEIIALAQDLKRKNLPVEPTQEGFTETENGVIKELMKVILKHGLSSDHAKALLSRTIQLLEWVKQAMKKMPEGNA